MRSVPLSLTAYPCHAFRCHAFCAALLSCFCTANTLTAAPSATVSNATVGYSVKTDPPASKADNADTVEDNHKAANPRWSVAEPVKCQDAIDNAVVIALQTDPAKAQAMLRNKKCGSDAAALVGKQACMCKQICHVTCDVICVAHTCDQPRNASASICS